MYSEVSMYVRYQRVLLPLSLESLLVSQLTQSTPHRKLEGQRVTQTVSV